MNDFQSFVLDWLDRRGWSQARLSEATGMSQSLLSKYLSSDNERRVRPSPDTLRKLAQVFGEPYENLLRMCGYLDGARERAPANELEQTWDAVTAEVFQQLGRTPEAHRAALMQAVSAYVSASVKMMVDLGQIASGTDRHPERRMRQLRRQPRVPATA